MLFNTNSPGEKFQTLFFVTVVLIECKYEIFRQLSLKDLNYKVILPGDQIVTPATSELYYNLQQRLKAW